MSFQKVPSSCTRLLLKQPTLQYRFKVILSYYSRPSMWPILNKSHHQNIVSDYRLKAGVRPKTEAKDFFTGLCAQTSSEAQPASYPVGRRGNARPRRDADYSPHLVPRSRMNMGFKSSLP
jgi:hypothetical protein